MRNQVDFFALRARERRSFQVTQFRLKDLFQRLTDLFLDRPDGDFGHTIFR